MRNDLLADFSGPVAQKHQMKGPVKFVTQVQSPVTNKKTDWLDGYSGQNYSAEYSRQSFLLKHISRNDHNEPQHITHYEYTSKGRISAVRDESLADHPLGGRTEGRIDYAFNPVTNTYVILDKRVIMGNPQNRRTETFVDSVKRISVQRTCEQDTLLTGENSSAWDAYGYLTKRASRSRSQAMNRFAFDKSGFDNFIKNELNVDLSEAEKKLVEKSLDSLKRGQDSLQKIQPEWIGDTTKYINKYDAKSRLVRQESYRRNQLTDVISYTYNAQTTRVVRQSFNRTGELTSESIRLQHPADNHILSDTSRHFYEGKWETSTYSWKDYPKPIMKYQYDNQGNWIEQKQVDIDGKQIGVALVRTIEYYP